MSLGHMGLNVEVHDESVWKFDNVHNRHTRFWIHELHQIQGDEDKIRNKDKKPLERL